MLATGDDDQVVRQFLRDIVPPDALDAMAQGPDWPAMRAVAPSLEPDVEAIAWTQSAPRPSLLSRVTAPTLILLGEQTWPLFPPAADSLVAALPDARQARVPGADHRWELAPMTEALATFFLSTV